MADGSQEPLRAGQTITLKQRLPTRLVMALGKWQNLDDSNALAVVSAVGEVLPLLSGLIVSWTFTDLDTGEPLPPPTAEALLDLDLPELLWIIEQITGGATPSKN